jgi:hypothetical protein
MMMVIHTCTWILIFFFLTRKRLIMMTKSISVNFIFIHVNFTRLYCFNFLLSSYNILLIVILCSYTNVKKSSIPIHKLKLRDENEKFQYNRISKATLLYYNGKLSNQCEHNHNWQEVHRLKKYHNLWLWVLWSGDV